MVRVTGFEPAASCSQTRRDTNFAIPGYSLFCHDTTAKGKNKVFSVCGHSCGQSRFCAVFGNRWKSRKCRCHKALRRFALPRPGYNLDIPNLLGILFSLIYSGFRRFLICFTYSLTLLSPLFPGVPEPSVVIYVVKNASRPAPVNVHRCRTGSVSHCCVVCIVTLSRQLCKKFLRRQQLKICGGINKEIAKMDSSRTYKRIAFSAQLLYAKNAV